jgi:hypothetical protein
VDEALTRELQNVLNATLNTFDYVAQGLILSTGASSEMRLTRELVASTR